MNRRDAHNFPLRYAAAFEVATNSYCLSNLLAKVRGGKFFVGKEALLTELQRIRRLQAEISDHEQHVNQLLEAYEKQ